MLTLHYLHGRARTHWMQPSSLIMAYRSSVSNFDPKIVFTRLLKARTGQSTVSCLVYLLIHSFDSFIIAVIPDYAKVMYVPLAQYLQFSLIF